MAVLPVGWCGLEKDIRGMSRKIGGGNNSQWSHIYLTLLNLNGFRVELFRASKQGVGVRPSNILVGFKLE